MTSENKPQELVVVETVPVTAGEEGSAVPATEPVEHEGGIVARAVQGHIQIDLEPRRSTYYSVTDAEIDVYAQFGWLSTIFLSLSGISTGFALGCVTAIAQGTLQAPADYTFRWIGGIAAVVAGVFFVLACALKYLQRENKKTWKISG